MREDRENYRLVTVITESGKVIEKIVLGIIEKYLKNILIDIINMDSP